MTNKQRWHRALIRAFLLDPFHLAVGIMLILASELLPIDVLAIHSYFDLHHILRLMGFYLLSCFGTSIYYEAQELKEISNMTTQTHTKITVLGLGYVGLTVAAGLAKLGHSVTGLDCDPKRIESLARGKMPFYERVWILCSKTS